MLTLEDCIELCGLNHAEIRYLMEHEHVSDLRIAELGEKYIVVDDAGTPHLRRSIVDDIKELKRRNRQKEIQGLEDFIRDFVLSHPHLNHDRPSDD